MALAALSAAAVGLCDDFAAATAGAAAASAAAEAAATQVGLSRTLLCTAVHPLHTGFTNIIIRCLSF
jgi:hypothetical protein